MWCVHAREWVSESVIESVSESVSESASEWVGEWVNEWISEWVSEWVNEWVSACMHMHVICVWCFKMWFYWKSLSWYLVSMVIIYYYFFRYISVLAILISWCTMCGSCFHSYLCVIIFFKWLTFMNPLSLAL